MVGYVPPVFKDHDPRFPVDDEKLNALGQQYNAVASDVPDPSTPVGAAVRALAIAVGGGGLSYTDNGDGTLTLTEGGAFVDNGDGTLTIGA